MVTYGEGELEGKGTTENAGKKRAANPLGLDDENRILNGMQGAYTHARIHTHESCCLSNSHDTQVESYLSLSRTAKLPSCGDKE